MSRRQFKSQASSSRAASNTYGTSFGGFGSSSGLGVSPSSLSFVSEPLDLSAISEPNVVVAFKNLSKKDSTTKAKALEDLRGYISSLGTDNGGVEDAVLRAWIKLYPRTSIDSARRVRQLAHILQGEIFVASSRQMARQISKFVGAWLAGTWDNDRQVSRSAHDSVKSVFTTEKKRQDLLKVYAHPILEYSRDALFKETVQTLSDERAVSPDDAEGKYARVVATSVCVVTHSLSVLGLEDVAKVQGLVDEILGDARLWDFSNYKDAFVRRSIYRLLKGCITKQKAALSPNLNEISISVISKALAIDQSGSSWDYTEALLALTSVFPTVWTGAYTDKRPASHYLRHFLKKGSQGGPPDFWDKIGNLFQAIPIGVLPQDASSASKLLGAYHDGITSSQEPKSNARAAWTNYFAVAARLLSLLPEIEIRKTLLEQSLFPIFEKYLRQTDEGAQCAISTQSPEVCARGFKVLAQLQFGDIQDLLVLQWRRLAGLLMEDMKTSMPGQAKGFEKSQGGLAQEANRWFSMQGILLKEPSLPFDFEVCIETSVCILKVAIEILNSRNGKPYGAAAVIDAALQKSSQLVLGNVAVKGVISSFVKSDLPPLILSPSASTLISLLYSYGVHFGQESPDFREALTAVFRAVLLAPDSLEKLNTIRDLLQRVPKTFGSLEPQPELEAYVLQIARLALEGKGDGWGVVNDALHIPGGIISREVGDQILSDMANSLSISDKTEFALQGIDSIIKNNKDRLATLLQTKKGSELLSSIVFLMESADEELAHRAEITNASIETSLLSGRVGQIVDGSLISIIKNGLLETSPSSISIQSLVGRAQKLLEDSPPESSRQLVDHLLPRPPQWEAAIEPFLYIPPKPSLAITDPLAGCVHLVERSGNTDSSLAMDLPRDSNGYSTAIRIASYTTRLLKANDVFSSLDQDNQIAIFKGIVLIMQLANDNLGLAGANHLWTQYSSDVEEDILGFISDSHGIIVKLLRAGLGGLALQPHAQDGFWVSAAPGVMSTRSFYLARASSLVYSELVELSGFKLSDAPAWIETLAEYRKNGDIFSASAMLSGISQPIAISREPERLRDRLISDLSGHDVRGDAEKGLRDLILLNGILADVDETATSLPQRRVIIFVKHVTTWFEINPSANATAIPEKPGPLAAEVSKVLASLLPQVKDMYDSFWVWVLDFLDHVWSRVGSPDVSKLAWNLVPEDHLPVIHATLKLYAVLDSIRTANMDLGNEWTSHSWTLAKCLFRLLKISPNVPDDFHQPLKVVNSLLSRQILALPSDRIVPPDELYPLLCMESRAVQQTAFEVLHRHIPRAQENISLNAALDKTTVRLPEELLSLVLGAPTLGDFEGSDFERSKPLLLRGYLLSWSLVFDHFSNASHKVRSCYIEDLKQGDFLSGLLDSTFNFLSRKGKLIDASRFDIVSYHPDTEDSAERDSQRLLLNLYFRALVLVPSLVRNWWFQCPRATRKIVEDFTEKSISPFVIDDALRRVSEWAGYQATSEEKKLQIKVSKREVIAGYEVDEQTMQMSIRFPPAYPLQQAAVEGVNRVGIEEKKWRAWLISTKGVITFSVRPPS
ncbi:MAG: hypothetical protein M1840_007770 [Geoglossum simile]|nr:MAG: hypothetical protein M1840_007770 [Geoglossum simile]